MITRDELKAALERWGAHDIDDKPDWANSVSSVVLRCRFQGPRWGRTTSNAARYLDALMRQGKVPWAVEMKVRGARGVGGYYRHAVGQAVLYRHWIRSATALDPWFTRQGLDRTAARAAVVVPALDTQPQWRTRLRTVCDLTGVELIEVPHQHAALR
ncbi:MULTISPECIES: hypothetical protein [Saccharothrix]|uniref:hypothetical protein n=1 Tax=Saccharothrix TaxID=2071 RepID=UPI00093A5413|nr:hypothetical protein [Saccharothrix sp. CB00851]OKI37984.1 hypothetical protein A6A25_17825 [Saccharothrix sp. CB00851]